MIVQGMMVFRKDKEDRGLGSTHGRRCMATKSSNNTIHDRDYLVFGSLSSTKKNTGPLCNGRCGSGTRESTMDDAQDGEVPCKVITICSPILDYTNHPAFPRFTPYIPPLLP
ncbi:hypothetical protein ECG_01934 [Echinococcus granulosus]|nr:hypothetical protein ECG_01934 [Echinococcus granulosus]